MSCQRGASPPRPARLPRRVRSVAASVVAALAAAAAAVAHLPPTTAAFSVYDHHPLLAGGPAAPGLEPALVESYGVRLDTTDPGRLLTRSSKFLPRASRYRLVGDAYPHRPLLGPSGSTFVGYHLLRTPYYGVDTDDWMRVRLRRDARVCLALGYRMAPRMALAGYWRAGLAVVRDGEQVVVDGKRQAAKAGIFCTDARAGMLSLPRASRLDAEAGEFGYDVLLAEAGGRLPGAPPAPPGRGGVAPNTRCPAWLHELWRTGTPEGEDAGTQGMTWRTWHPQVDPIYWCYYGHDHGSAPHFQSVPPRFGYTAYKNTQDESHIGFKGYGLVSDDVSYYLTVHASTSEVRRIRERHHTVTLAATSRSTGETLADLSCKGDFGFTFVLGVDFRTRPDQTLTVGGWAQEQLFREARRIPFGRRPKNSKRVNVWSGTADTDPLVDQKDLPRGRYEKWIGGFDFCSTSPNGRGFTLDVKDAVTACKTRECPKDEPLTRLAPYGDPAAGVFTPNRGLRRDLIFDRLRLSRQACGEAGAADTDGDVFYTDPYCTERRSGPGPNTVRQVLKRGWVGQLDGKYASLDSWYGGYTKVRADDARGGFESIEQSISSRN